jgi:putative transposase
VEAGADFRPTGDSCTLAQGWIQVVLGMAFAESSSGGRKCVSIELRELIFRMVAEDPTWGASRIHGELRMLGFDISEWTVLR